MVCTLHLCSSAERKDFFPAMFTINATAQLELITVNQQTNDKTSHDSISVIAGTL